MPRELLHWHVVVLTYACETCGAPPGQPCVSSSGLSRGYEPHVARSNLARAHGWVAADLLDELEGGDDEGR